MPGLGQIRENQVNSVLEMNSPLDFTVDVKILLRLPQSTLLYYMILYYIMTFLIWKLTINGTYLKT